MSYNEYLRDKKRALPQVISPTRINTAGLFTQMQRYKAAVPQGTMESAGVSVQHKSGSNVLATIGNAAVCCAPAQATVTTSCGTTSSTTTPSGWPAIIVGDNESSYSLSEAIYSNGDRVFVTGYFSGSIDLYNGGVTDPTTATPAIQLTTLVSLKDGFVAVYSETGQLEWATIIETRTGTETIGNRIAVDATGIYVTGTFDGDIEFYDGWTSGSHNPDVGSGVKTLTLSDSLGGLFIVKYSLSGIFQWVTKINNVAPAASQTPLFAYGICTNGTNLYVNAIFDVSASVYNAPDESIQFTILQDDPDTSSAASLLVKFNTTTGTAQWATKMVIAVVYDSFYSAAITFGLTCDTTNVYMSGTFFTGMTYYNTVANNTDTFISEGTLQNNQNFTFPTMYIIKYDASGNFQWVNTSDVANANFNPNEGVAPRLSVSGTSLYALIMFTADLYVYQAPDTYVEYAQLTTGTEDFLNIAIVKYDIETGEVSSVNKITNIVSIDSFDLSLFTCDIYAGNSTIYVTGGFNNNSINIYNAANLSDPTVIGATLTAVSESFNLFLIKYNSDGEPLWMTIADSPSGEDMGIGVRSDDSRTFITGTGQGNIIFYNANELNQPSTEAMTINGTETSYSFVVEYDENGQVITPQQTTASSSSGTCNLKLQPYPRNGYRPPRCDPPAINYPPVDPGICHCP